MKLPRRKFLGLAAGATALPARAPIGPDSRRLGGAGRKLSVDVAL